MHDSRSVSSDRQISITCTLCVTPLSRADLDGVI